MDPRRAAPNELQAAKGAVGVAVIDERTIRFRLTEPAAYFASIAYMWVGMPVKQESLDRGGDRWTEPATYIGNGPFKLIEWKHNQKMVFERNEIYWRGPAKVRRWTAAMINEGAVAFAAYRNNELDSTAVTAEALGVINADPDLRGQVVDAGGPCTFYVGYDARKAPFDDVKVGRPCVTRKRS